MAAVYSASAPEFDIRHEIVRVNYGDELPERCYPLYEFRIATARAVKALAKYDASGSVVPFEKPPEDH